MVLSPFIVKMMRSACWSTGTFWQNKPPQADTPDKLTAESISSKVITNQRRLNIIASVTF
jgi:hypothetical protein